MVRGGGGDRLAAGEPDHLDGDYEGKPYQDKGEILEVDPGRLLKLTHWSPLTGQPDVPENYHTLTYTLDGNGTATHLKLTQDNNAQRGRGQALPGHVGDARRQGQGRGRVLRVSNLIPMATDGVEVDRPTRERAAIGEDGRSRDRTRPAVPDPLPMSVVDAHCHLDIADGEDGAWLSPAEAIKLASSVGVTRIVQVGCDLPGAVWAVEAAEQYPNLIAGVALHPNEAPKLKAVGELDSALAEIERLAATSDKVRVIGETGLDYFRTGEDGRAAQHESFAAHIELAKRLDKTLMIHDRDAHDDILKILDREGVPDRLVMHCFSGDTEFARKCVERGAFLSFAGVVTFKNAQSLRDALAVTPLDRVLVETDAPYLTPSPHRGQPNASYLIPHTVRKMAGVLNISVAELCGALNDNANRAFGGAW